MFSTTVEDEVSFTKKYSLIATINHSGALNRVIIGLLSSIYTHLSYWAFIKYLHSSSWYSSNDKLGFSVEERSLNSTISYILFTKKFECSPGSTNNVNGFFLQGGFVISDIVFGCDDPTYNPSPVQKLSLLTQFSGFTTLQSLVLEKHCKGARSSMVLSMRSDNLTYNPSPSNS